MSGEQNKDNADLTVEQLVRLKKDLNESITCGHSNLNARQVTELQKIDAAQSAKIRREYDEWYKRMRTNPLILFAIAAAGIAAWFYFKNWIGSIGLVCAILAG